MGPSAFGQFEEADFENRCYMKIFGVFLVFEVSFFADVKVINEKAVEIETISKLIKHISCA